MTLPLKWTGAVVSMVCHCLSSDRLMAVVLHETAHHICHKLGLNGHGNWHDHNFGRILQEMIDDVL